MKILWGMIGPLLLVPSLVFAEDVRATRPLISGGSAALSKLLPGQTRLLEEAPAIEQFLDALDGMPPDWAAIYGHGHHDPGHDDRLFALNRERDAKREGKPALQWTVTFLWYGELSSFDPTTGGFGVTVGPRFHPTRWGVVRFKAENLPGNLTAVPNPSLRETLRRKIEKGQKVEVQVACTGRLIPEESLVYDFSHEEEGRGLIMPVVRLERVDYLLPSR